MRSLLYRTSPYSTPAQSRPSFTWSNASGRRGFSSEPIVSSKTKRSRPWYRFVYASFRTNARAFPMCSGPLGYGARRRTTLPSAAPGSGGSSFGPTSARVRSSSSGAIKVSWARCASGARRFTSATIPSTAVAASPARPRREGSSASSRPRTAFASALPSCRIALCNANFLAESRLTVVRTERAYKDFFGAKPRRRRAMRVDVPGDENGPRLRVPQKVSQERLWSAGRPTIRGPGVVEAALVARAGGDRVRGLGHRAVHPRGGGRDPRRTDGRADRGRPPSDRRPERPFRRRRERGARPGTRTDRLLPVRLR